MDNNYKYLIDGLPYRPGTIVYYLWDARIAIGEVKEVNVRLNDRREVIEYVVEDCYMPNDYPKLHLGEDRIALDITKLLEVLQAVMEEAHNRKKGEMFDVDKN